MTVADTCPVCSQCGQATVLAFRTTDRNQRLSEAWFAYYRCLGCETIGLSPVPYDLGRYYKTDYPAYRLNDFPERKALERCKVDLLLPHVRSGRLLEIGPSSGAFAKAAQEAGFEVQAIEMDRDCCDYLTHTLGIPTQHSNDPCSAIPTDAAFDVIALWHVIEHLIDPWTTLARLADALRPGGVLAVSAPNPRSLQFRLFRGRWVHVDAPRHLWLIPLLVLTERLAKHGLVRIAATATDPIGLQLNVMGWKQSMTECATTPFLRTALRKSGRVVAMATTLLERNLTLGAAYTAIYRKQDAQPDG